MARTKSRKPRGGGIYDRREKDRPKKDYHLGVKIERSYLSKLEAQQIKNGDENKSITARKILYQALDQ